MPKQLLGKTSDFLRTGLPACSAGNLSAVKAFLKDERGLVNWIGSPGRTMLWEAARKGKSANDIADGSRKIGIEEVRQVFREIMDP